MTLTARIVSAPRSVVVPVSVPVVATAAGLRSIVNTGSTPSAIVAASHATRGTFTWSTVARADDGVTRFNPGGGTGDGWEREFSGPIDIFWANAVGDGDISGGVGTVTGTDDTAAFQAAIGAAVATGVREVLLPQRGRNKGYRIRNTVTQLSSVLIRGMSTASTLGAAETAILWDPAIPDANQACILVEPDTENAGGGIENLLIFQSSSVALTGAGNAIHLKHSGTFGLKPSHFHIKDVFVDAFDADPWTWGYVFEGVPDALPTDYLRDCSITGGRVTGCALPGLPKVFTSDHTTDTLTSVGHGMSNGNEVRLFTTSALPAPLSPLTTYFVRDSAADTFKLAATSGGAAINLSDNGTGVHNASRRLDFKSGGGGIKFYACANMWLHDVALNNQCRILIDSDDAEYFSTAFYLTTCMIDELEIGNAQDVYVRGGRYDAIQCHSLAQNNIFFPDYVAVKPVPLGGVNNQYVAIHAPTADFVSTGAFASYDTASSTLTSLLRLSGGVVRILESGGFPITFGGASSIGSAGSGDLVVPSGRGLWGVVVAGGSARRMIAMAGPSGGDIVFLDPDSGMPVAFGTRFYSWVGGAFSMGVAANNDTATEAQAGLTGPVVNVAPTTGGAIASVANQVTLYNVAGVASVQGHAGFKAIVNTTTTIEANATGLGFYGATPVAQASRAGQLTDSTTGTANNTCVDVTTTGLADPVKCNDNFADLIAKVNALETIIHNLGLST